MMLLYGASFFIGALFFFFFLYWWAFCLYVPFYPTQYSFLPQCIQFKETHLASEHNLLQTPFPSCVFTRDSRNGWLRAVTLCVLHALVRNWLLPALNRHGFSVTLAFLLAILPGLARDAWFLGFFGTYFVGVCLV